MFRVLVVMLLVVASAAAQGSDLARAQQLLHGMGEAEVTQGTDLCVKAGSLKASKLLIDVLKRKKTAPRPLAAAHYRDIVWNGLVRIKDPASRAYVAKLARSARSPWVRQWCVELLGIWSDPQYVAPLILACTDKNEYVRRWAARSLGLLRQASSADALYKLTRAKSPYVRANAIEALAWIDPKKHAGMFEKALTSDPDGGVRCALLGAVPGIYNTDTVKRSRAALRDVDWRPRMQAVDNLNRPEKVAVDGLVEATKDGRPVIADRATGYLRKLTGKDIRDPGQWAAWWKANRKDFKFPEGEEQEEEKKKETKTVSFNQIPLVSDHVAFLMDRSVRMKAQLQSASMSKDAASYKELNDVLGKLHGRLVFNVYCYREDVKVFSKRPVKCDPKQQKKALAFVGKQKTKGAKDIWKLLE
ncbi:MAG: HEAT repeat domain-containing protein, partial [Planctomycetota bacterium]